MLDLFNLKEKNHINKLYQTTCKKTTKHFPSPLREWKNSIYVYNKNSLNLIPSATILALNIIKSYFAFFNKTIESKLRTKRLLLRLRRSSSNKYYISNGGFKHTNNKVLINLHIFNRQRANYLLSLKNWYLKAFLTEKTIARRNINMKLIKRLKLINRKGIEAVKILNKDKYLLIKALNNVLKNKKFNLYTFKDLSKYTEDFYKKVIKKSLRKIKIYFYYKQLLYINKSKLNYTYLKFLKNQLEKLFNKNVEFNLIKVERFYLNGDILAESITSKIARNRGKINKYINKLKNKVYVMSTSTLNKRSKQNFIQPNLSRNKLSLQDYVMNNLKYRHITGFRLKAKGRLNRRFTASRSVTKIIYKGHLYNIDSSYKGLSSVMLKGNLKSHMQYTKLKSKSRVGSFGIRGWVSGN